MTDGYIDFDATADYIRIDANGTVSGQPDSEGIALETRVTVGGHRWSDDDWKVRVDQHLRIAAGIARIFGTYVRFNQLWCETRARKIGAWLPMPEHITGRAAEDAERARRLALHGPMGAGDITDQVARVIEGAMRAAGTGEFFARFGADDAAPLVLDLLTDLGALPERT